MLATKIVCPHCHKSLKTTRPLAIGKRILCKQCGTTFRAGSPDVAQGISLPAPNGIVPAAALPPLEDAPITTELDGTRLARIAMVAVVLAGGFLLVGGGSVLALVYAATHKEKPQAASTKKVTEPEEPTPPEVALEEPVNPSGEPVAVQTPRLGPEEQARVNNAVEKGLAFLKKQQLKSGAWAAGHPVGMSALPALTLLECGVAPDDPQVQKAAEMVRKTAPNFAASYRSATYELSLAILFLDRLGDPKDHALIQSLALRLVAGQRADGGWTYECPLLSSREEKELLDILKRTRPSDPLELFTGADGKVQPEFVIAPKGGGDANGPFKGNTEVEPRNSASDLKKELEKAPPRSKRIPSLQPPEAASKFNRNAGSDNSNTQFAILAIWVASRHDLPLERPIALIVKRFRTTQHKDGTWGYHSSLGAQANQSPAMTAAGLLGLGVGHGMMASTASKDQPQAGLQDPAIANAFRALSENIGMPLGSKRKTKNVTRAGINLYLLWSIERVGVMYNLTKFLDKDWYQWGAEQLVDTQGADGSWHSSDYPGASPVLNTALALLFLQRANLTKDLAKKLELVIDVKGLGSR